MRIVQRPMHIENKDNGTSPMAVRKDRALLLSVLDKLKICQRKMVLKKVSYV